MHGKLRGQAAPFLLLHPFPMAEVCEEDRAAISPVFLQPREGVMCVTEFTEDRLGGERACGRGGHP